MTDPLLKLLDRRWRCTACGKTHTSSFINTYDGSPIVRGYARALCTGCGHIFKKFRDGITCDLSSSEKLDLQLSHTATMQRDSQARIVKAICPND